MQLFQHYMLCLFQETKRDIETEPGWESSDLDQHMKGLGACPHQPDTRFI